MSNRDEADADNQERWGAQVPADQYQDRPCSPESGLSYSLLEPSTGHTAEQQSVHPDDSQDDGEGDQHKAQHKEREQIPSPPASGCHAASLSNPTAAEISLPGRV
ncbi:hypothetical protein ACIPH4_26235 [Streptomyces tendae]|uniref:hypothetical protein n=1 Tax=Streptomyces tendae TaxID=1932 RepID=UPI00381DE28A